MLALGEKLVNKSEMRMRPLGKNDFFVFRRAATESTATNYEYLAYGQLFENLNVFEFAREYTSLLRSEISISQIPSDLMILM